MNTLSDAPSSAYMIVLLVLYTARKPAFFIFIDCNVVFSALTYMLINVRVALGTISHLVFNYFGKNTRTLF